MSCAQAHWVGSKPIRRVMQLIMMVLCPKAGSLAFTPPGDEMSEVVSHCLPHRQLWVSNLSKVATQWREVDSNPRPFGCKPKHIPLHHGAPRIIYQLTFRCASSAPKRIDRPTGQVGSSALSVCLARSLSLFLSFSLSVCLSLPLSPSLH